MANMIKQAPWRHKLLALLVPTTVRVVFLGADPWLVVGGLGWVRRCSRGRLNWFLGLLRPQTQRGGFSSILMHIKVPVVTASTSFSSCRLFEHHNRGRCASYAQIPFLPALAGENTFRMGENKELGLGRCLLFMHDVEATGTGNDSQVPIQKLLVSTDLATSRPT